MFEVDPWVTGIAGFLSGCAVGAFGGYFADRFTDGRRRRESEREARRLFDRHEAEMPALFAEMREDLERDPFVRRFFVMKSTQRLGRSSEESFVYFTDQIDSLLPKCRLLEEDGMLDDITEGNVPIFRMRDGFARMLRP